MTEKQQPSIQILRQYIKDLSYEAPNQPIVLKEQPKIDIKIDIATAKADNNNYIVDLVTKITASQENKQIFICELTYGAIAHLEVEEKMVEPILLVEIPHLLFPYSRSLISTIISESGLPPINLQPINFAALYQQKKATQQ